MTTRVLGILAALAMALALAGCGDETGSGRDSSAVAFSLPVGEPTYDVDAPTWAVGDTIHVGDQEITVKPAPDVYVVATGGVYYLAKQILYFTDGGPVEKVGPTESSTLAESDDGRYLGVMAAAEGTEDEYGTAVRVPAVFDLETGAEVLHAEPGKVSKGDDLADLYEDASVGFRGFADGAAYVDDPLREGYTTRFPLDGGDPEPLPTDDFGLSEVPAFAGEGGIEVTVQTADGGGWQISESGDGYHATLSPDERYLFVEGQRPYDAFYDVESGEPIRFDPGSRSFLLGGWTDDETFYGVTNVGGGGESPRGRVSIVSCTTTSLACTPVSPDFPLPTDPYLVFGTGTTPLD